MKNRKYAAGLLLLLMAAASPATGATVSVDADDVLHERPPSLIGGNIEDLNFQLYGGLYSQLIHGECFEEHVDPTELFGLEGPDRCAVWVLPDKNGQPALKMHGGRGHIYQEDGTVLLEDGPWARKRIDQVWKCGGLAFRRKSVLFPRDLPETLGDKLIELATGDRQVSRHWRPLQSGSAKGQFTLVGEDVHTGLRAQQIVFLSGKGEVGIDNAGLFRAGINLVGGKPCEGLLRVKSVKPQELYLSLRDANGRVLAEEVRKLSGNESEYQRISFALTPSTSAAAGRFAVALRGPGTITVDYASLQAGEWGRYRGLPVRKEMAEAMLGMGVKTIRYNGSMVNRNPSGSTAYRWRKMIGPVDEREPYHGFFNPYASHGFTLFDFMDFAEAAGLVCMVGIHTSETPQDMMDFVEYCLGDGTTPWGKRRIAHGHPKPYRLQCIQIGNEEKANGAYLETVRELATAIWSKDPSIDIAASNNDMDEATPEYLDLVKWLIDQGRQDRFLLDSHYTGTTTAADKSLDVRLGYKLHRALKEHYPAFSLRLWPMEENGHTCDWSRGLGHAHNLNTMHRMPLCLERAGTANVFQPVGLHLIWDQGRIHYTPSKIFYQPSYYVDRMFADEWLPVVLNARSSDPLLDVTAKKSRDGTVLTLYVVNLKNEAVATELKIKGLKAADASVLQIGSPDLATKNTVEHPERIKPEEVEWSYTGGRSMISLPAQSFTSIRLAAKERR